MAPKKHVAPKWDAEAVLKPVKKLRSSMGAQAAKKRTLADVGMSEGVTKEVMAMDEPQGVRAD